MKKMLVAAMLAVTLIFSGTSALYAADAEQAAASVPNQEELARAINTVEKALAVATGKGGEKNMADVADRALSLVQDSVASFAGTLSETVKAIAPDVWRIMITQQYAVAITSIACYGLALLGLIMLVAIIRKKWVLNDQSGEDEVAFHMILTAIVPCIAGVFMSGFFLDTLSENLPKLINPEFYAIKAMLEMASGAM